jgi:flagellar hook-associated protein 1 FlgK
MGTISSAFSLISGALDADQSALSIVANNVANANTPGYTEEVPNWQENQPVTINGVAYGAGVTETGATSLRDRVLEGRLDQQQQLASASGARLTALNSLQGLFTPDSGSSTATAGDIGSDITSLFSSFSSLESSPTNSSLREEVLSSAKTLAGDVSNAAASLNAQSSALDQQASGATSQINALTTSIAQLNQQIVSTSPTADAGTLEDQRQQDLSQLSQLVGINQITTQDNGLSVTTTSGQLLVSEGSSFQMTTSSVGGASHVFVGTADVTTQLASGGGQLGGILTARDQDIEGALSSLDQLAFNVSTSVNALNNAGTDLNGTEGTGTNAAGVTGTGSTPLYIFNQPTTMVGSADRRRRAGAGNWGQYQRHGNGQSERSIGDSVNGHNNLQRYAKPRFLDAGQRHRLQQCNDLRLARKQPQRCDHIHKRGIRQVGIQHLGSGYGCSEHQRRQPGELHLRSGRNGESGNESDDYRDQGGRHIYD